MSNSGLHNFLTVAANQSVDAAIAAEGDAVSAREAAGIESLTSDELKQLHALHQKIIDATKAPAGASGDATAWACGAVC